MCYFKNLNLKSMYSFKNYLNYLKHPVNIECLLLPITSNCKPLQKSNNFNISLVSNYKY